MKREDHRYMAKEKRDRNKEIKQRLKFMARQKDKEERKKTVLGKKI